MKVVFLGTPEAAVPSLEALVRAEHEVVLVITRPDRRRGRGGLQTPSPVKAAAERLGLPVAHTVRAVAECGAAIGVVVAYGAMVPRDILDVVPMVNVHFSLLPRWRGAAPVERAILAGDLETGVGIMGLEETLDTGPLFAERRVTVGVKTASALTAELAEVGAELLVDVLASPQNLVSPTPQTGEVTYAEKLTSETFRLTPTMTALQAERVVRLERAWCEVGGKRFRVHAGRAAQHQATAGHFVRSDGIIGLGLREGVLWLETVQPEGSRAMDAGAWWQGARLHDGDTWS